MAKTYELNMKGETAGIEGEVTIRMTGLTKKEAKAVGGVFKAREWKVEAVETSVKEIEI